MSSSNDYGLPAPRPIQKMSSLQSEYSSRNDNKAIMSSLKQQMINIREGMSRLIKIKSEQALLPGQKNNKSSYIPSLLNSNNSIYNRFSNINTNFNKDKNKDTEKCNDGAPSFIESLQNRIKFLYEQNGKLQNVIKQNAQKNKQDLEKLNKSYGQLEEKYKQQGKKLKDVTLQLQKIKQKKDKYQNPSPSVSPKKSDKKQLQKQFSTDLNKFPRIQILNPQLESLSSIPSHKLQKQLQMQRTFNDSILKQNESLKKAIIKQEIKSKNVQRNSYQNLVLIQTINQKLVRCEARKLDAKYSKNSYI